MKSSWIQNIHFGVAEKVNFGENVHPCDHVPKKF